MADNHPLKKSDAKAHERLIGERRTTRRQSFEDGIKAAGLAVEQRKKLWDALAKYIHDNGCFLVSSPSEKHLRIEVPQGSALPAKLRQAGFSPRHITTGTRIQTGAFLPVDVTAGEVIRMASLLNRLGTEKKAPPVAPVTLPQVALRRVS